MTLGMAGRSRWDEIARSSAPELAGESVNILRNPSEFATGLIEGAVKSIPDTFAYPLLLGGAVAGKVGTGLGISQGSGLARNSLKMLEAYENAAQKGGTEISRFAGNQNVDDEESQKALRIGLTAGSFINPITGLKKFAPELGAVSGYRGRFLDFLEGGAIGAATSGISTAQKHLGEPLTKGVAKVASPIWDLALKGGAAFTGQAKKIIPKDITDNVFVRGAEAHFNPRMDSERIQAVIPDFFTQISDKLEHPVVSLDDIGNVLSTRKVKEHDLNNWIDSLTLPKAERTFDQLVSDSKVTGNKSNLDNALNTIFENDPKKKVLASKLIDSGNIQKLEKLDPAFNMKYDIWKSNLPEDANNVLTFGEEELPLIKSGIAGGYLRGIKKVDPIKDIVHTSQKVQESNLDLSRTHQEALEKDIALQSQWDTYNKTIADTIQNAKIKRVEYRQAIPELERQSKENITALNKFQKQIYESNPQEVEQLQKQVVEHENSLKSFQENLKVTPEERQVFKKDYLQAKKEYNTFLKSEATEAEGQLNLEGVGDIRQQKLQELQTNLSLAEERFRNAGKPTEMDLLKTQEIQTALENAKNRLKTYSRIPTPEEIQQLSELEQQAQQSYDQAIRTKEEFGNFLTDARQQIKNARSERVQFKNSMFGDTEEDLSRKNWGSAKNKALEGYKDSIKYHENVKKSYEKELKRLQAEPYEARYQSLKNATRWGNEEDKTKAQTRFLEGAADELTRKNDDIYNAFHTADKETIRKAQEGLYNQKKKTLQDISDLDTTDENKRILTNNYITNFDYTLAGLFTKNVMYQKLEPAAGQMFQIISALPPVRSSELEKIGMPYGEYLKRYMKASDYRKSKYGFFDNAIYKPNRTVSDAFGLGTNLEDLALQNVDRGAVKNAISAIAAPKMMQILGKLGDIVGYSAVEGAKRMNIDTVFDDAYAMASWMADRQRIPIGSKQFDDLVVKQTNYLLSRVGEKSFSASYSYKSGVGGYKAIKNFEERLNNIAGEYGRGAKDVMTTLMGWLPSAYHSVLQSYNQVGDAVERVRRTGKITQHDREAVVRYVGDVLTNGILFGARGAGKLPGGLIEPIQDAKLQENKQTIPMLVANWILSFLPRTSDDVKIKILEGVLGAKSEIDGSGGLGTTFERQKTLPLVLGFGGPDIIRSVMSGYLKSSFNLIELMKKDPDNWLRNLGVGLADGIFSTALYRKDAVNIGESVAEGTLKDMMKVPITPEFGSPSRIEIGTIASLKNKPASFSAPNQGFSDIQQRNRKLEEMYSDIPTEEFINNDGINRFLDSAEAAGYNLNDPEALKKVTEILGKTMESQKYPKFISKKFKRLDTMANSINMTSDDYIEKKRILESVSEQEAADLLGMSLIVGGKKQSKMIEFLAENKLLNLKDKDKFESTLDRASKFVNTHKRQITPEMQSFFDSLNEEDEED